MEKRELITLFELSMLRPYLEAFMKLPVNALSSADLTASASGTCDQRIVDSSAILTIAVERC
jgi:hypothetical protein